MPMQPMNAVVPMVVGPALSDDGLFLVACAITAVALFGLGSLKARFTDKAFLQAGERTACCTHRVWVSKCLIPPIPCRAHMPIAALESVQTRTGNLKPKSFSSDW